MTETLHQARTIVKGMVEQHLLISTMFQSERASLRIFNSKPDGTRESEATIYLSTEQWAELAVVAAEQAKKNVPTKSQSDYLNNEQVNAWQDANVAAALEKKVAEALSYLNSYAPEQWTTDYGIEADVMDTLIKREWVEYKEARSPSGQPRPKYRLTALGRLTAASGDTQ